ncbi:MAG: transglutaminase-like domain-containing protein [Bacteroidota bacterium]
MADRHQLPFLLKLLDDDSSVVRESVLHELKGFGLELEEEVALLHYEQTPEQRSLLNPLYERNRAMLLTTAWPEWFDLEDDKLQLESAMSLIAEYQLGHRFTGILTERLDTLAERCGTARATGNVLALSRFLFEEMALHGAPESSYYNPLNSNLIVVLDEKQGIPLSLCCIYVLVADRVGLMVEGCNFPGHFLAIAFQNEQRFVIDCFNKGRILEDSHLDKIKASITMEDIFRLQCRAPVIITRTLRNLIAAYQQAGDDQAADLMTGILQLTTSALHLE